MLWKWEARDRRTLPKAYSKAGNALKKRLDEVCEIFRQQSMKLCLCL